MCRKFMFLSLASALALNSMAQAANIIWVSDNKGYGSVEPNTPGDQGWVDLLTAQGHNVIYRNQYEYIDGQQYWRTLDPNKTAELEAADLIILSRNADSGSYSTAADNEPNLWNAVTTPLISLSAHMSRVGKWGWLNGTATTYAKEGEFKVVDPNHPVCAGVAIDPNGMVDVLDAQWNVDWVKDVNDAGNGKLLATRASDGLVSIVTWEAGQEYFPGSGQFAGGPRMLFIAGTGSKNTGSNYAPDGMCNLTAEGEKMFLNAVNFMLPPPGLRDDFVDTFETAHNYLTEGLGAYAGMLNGTISALDANTTRPGALYFESAGGVWDPGPGPMLYVEVSGDFVATATVTDYAGTADAYVYYNNCGLMARALPADGGDGEDWIAIDYFPLYGVGNIVRYCDDGVRYEDVGGNGTAFDGHTYLQLERVGNTFYLRTSADGVTWVDYPDPLFSPLERPDLEGVPLQVGLAQCTFTPNAGYAAFDDFSVVLPRTEVTVGSAADTWMVRDDPDAHGELDYMVLHGGSQDRTGYVRFDLSGLNIQSIKSATLTLFVHGSIPKPPYRNDSCVTGRFALYGLNNVAGNTAQDWDEAALTSAGTGAEMDWATGAVVTADGRAVDLDDGVAGITETVAPTSSPGNASLGATVTITGDALVSFLQSRVDDNGLVTFILKNDDGNDRGYGLCTKEFADEAYRPRLELTAVVKP